MRIFYKNDDLIIKNSDWKNIVFSPNSKEVFIDDFSVSYPWEYEKSGILFEVKEYNNVLFYRFIVDSKHIAIITSDSFEIKEEILSFFWDIDLLIIIWTKDAIKIFENIEAKVVVPYWESKDIFLNSMWQNSEEINKYKIKAESDLNNTEFVNLA
jgi:hypothetical protein